MALHSGSGVLRALVFCSFCSALELFPLGEYSYCTMKRLDSPVLPSLTQALTYQSATVTSPPPRTETRNKSHLKVGPHPSLWRSPWHGRWKAVFSRSCCVRVFIVMQEAVRIAFLHPLTGIHLHDRWVNKQFVGTERMLTFGYCFGCLTATHAN